MPTASGVPNVTPLWTAAPASDPGRSAFRPERAIALGERNGYVSSMHSSDRVATASGAGNMPGWEHLAVAEFGPLAGARG
jgi:hypothetical protein